MTKSFYPIVLWRQHTVSASTILSGMNSDLHAPDTGWAHSGTLLVGTQDWEEIRLFGLEFTLPVASSSVVHLLPPQLCLDGSTHVDFCLSRPTCSGAASSMLCRRCGLISDVDAVDLDNEEDGMRFTTTATVDLKSKRMIRCCSLQPWRPAAEGLAEWDPDPLVEWSNTYWARSLSVTRHEFSGSTLIPFLFCGADDEQAELSQEVLTVVFYTSEKALMDLFLSS
ncbi:hypothetical protein CPC08DRAFT_753699 [Agrocybe pediades]|nr:hypothetical protein CPC08DRAFT_753699 [Agrocybe pediades]